MKRLIFLLVFLSGCTKGTHVEYYRVEQPSVIKYTCNYRAGSWSVRRQVAICDTAKECYDICQQYNPPKD